MTADYRCHFFLDLKGAGVNNIHKSPVERTLDPNQLAYTQAKIIKLVDISYGGENGFNQVFE